MKKIISALILASLLIVPLGILAAYTGTTVPSVELDIALDRIMKFAFWLLIAVAVIFLIFAGLTFVTAQGDPEKIKKARDYVLYALIGVVVGVLAKGLTTFFKDLLD